MNSFFIANVRVKDSEKFQEYAGKAGASMQPHGGEVLIKGKLNAQLAGEMDYPVTAIVTFPDVESLRSWFHSDSYQQIIPLRDEAADMILTSYDQLG